MKIVYCIAGTFNSGGMERVLANKANYLVEHGYEVAVVTSDQKERPSHFDMDSRISFYDLGINYCDHKNSGVASKTFSYLKKQKTHFIRLKKLLLSIKADIVVSMFDNDANLVWKVKDGSKKVLEIHFSRYKRLQYGRKGLWKMVDLWRSRQDVSIAKKYAKFIVLTDEDKEYWGDLDNMTVIPNANSFEPHGRAELKQKNVIAIGRYDYQKAFEELISIWRSVKKVSPDWKLNIFGEGELKSYYEGLIAEFGLNDVVKLCPVTNSIEKEYLQSSIFAMTSRYEGLPMAMLEAQSHGLPLVSYTCKCGPRDIIVEGVNGFLVDEKDQKKFAEKLILLMSDPDLRQEMGSHSFGLSNRFSQENIMDKWERLFHNLSKR